MTNILLMEAPIIPPDGRILYCARDQERFGFLACLYSAPILLDGETWPTVEHYIVAQRSDDPDYRRTILEASAPELASDSWFERNNAQRRAGWYRVEVIEDLMMRANRAKFTQHPELARLLIATESTELVEDTSNSYWGIDENGEGLNRAGAALMEIREEMRALAAIRERFVETLFPAKSAFEQVIESGLLRSPTVEELLRSLPTRKEIDFLSEIKIEDISCDVQGLLSSVICYLEGMLAGVPEEWAPEVVRHLEATLTAALAFKPSPARSEEYIQLLKRCREQAKE